ncbi:MAG TPA: hypothetical protein VFI37_07580 [Gaiellaceae bacterium]|jgi:hypothetical protein|nr:hypothetical protein [Gaiellaceae bacterium]
MARPSLKTILLLAVGSWAGSALYRRRGLRRQRVDLYYEDGAIVSLPEGSLGADRLLSLAHELLHA